MDVVADDAMRLLGGKCNVARHLLLMNFLRAEAERSGIFVAGLFSEARPVDRATVETGRCAGLQTASTQSKQLQRLAQ